MSKIPSDTPRATPGEASIEFINAQPEEKRLDLYAQMQRELGGRASGASGTTDFDEYVAVVNAGIEEALRRAELESDTAQRNVLIDRANIFSFNLLADLAECWPGERARPERRHFEEGLRAADNCIAWREQLGKPADRQAMAWWGKGMHLLSLGRIPDAVEAFRRAVALVMPESAHPIPPDSFDQLLYSGYLAIAESLDGDADARSRYTAILEAFTLQLTDSEKKEDAAFGIEQLETVAARFMG